MAKDSNERIIEAATRLFALKGYHGTSMRDIARAVDLTVATVQGHAGSKEMLYQEVFRRQYEEDYKIIHSALDECSEEQKEALVSSAPLVRQFIKAVWKKLIGRFQDSPELVRLWTYRWLESDELALDIDQKYSIPLYHIEVEMINKAQQKGVITSTRLENLIWMSGFSWLQMGYFTGRNLVRDLGEDDPFGPKSMAAFYAFLDRYVDRMIQFEDSSSLAEISKTAQ
ncbi:MAG: helix-turn-helix domain containing protein [Chloroflexi bacterium]|nr:helix-turn-helix domain containing protein [Chloroflexota bacterium]